MPHTVPPIHPPLDNAIKEGQTEVTRPKTLEIFAKKYGPNLDKYPINFRGDVAEKFGYDKIQPISQPMTVGNLVYIKGKSNKSGQEGVFQIWANQWGLLEVLAKLE